MSSSKNTKIKIESKTSTKIKKEYLAPKNQSNNNQTTCPICLNDIDPRQTIAIPSSESCLSHIFCLDCLLTWTKSSTASCPVDRKPYNAVHVYESLFDFQNHMQTKALKNNNNKKSNTKKSNTKKRKKPDKIFKIDKEGKIKQKLEQIGKKEGRTSKSYQEKLAYYNSNYILCQNFVSNVDDEFEEQLLMEQLGHEENNCQICGLSTNEEILLICDGCNFYFHTTCLSPPLDCVPEDDWFCDSCMPDALDDIRYEIAENRSELRRTRMATRSQVTLPEDPVDVRIQSMVDQVMTMINLDRPMTSSQNNTRNRRRRSRSRRKRISSKRKTARKGTKRKNTNTPNSQRKRAKEENDDDFNFQSNSKNSSGPITDPLIPTVSLDNCESDLLPCNDDYDFIPAPILPEFSAEKAKQQAIDRKDFVKISPDTPFMISDTRYDFLTKMAISKRVENSMKVSKACGVFDLQKELNNQTNMMNRGRHVLLSSGEVKMKKKSNNVFDQRPMF